MRINTSGKEYFIPTCLHNVFYAKVHFNFENNDAILIQISVFVSIKGTYIDIHNVLFEPSKGVKCIKKIKIKKNHNRNVHFKYYWSHFKSILLNVLIPFRRSAEGLTHLCRPHPPHFSPMGDSLFPTRRILNDS